MNKKPEATVSVVMGSDSDHPVMDETVKVLREFDIGHEVVLTSAHRSPERTSSFAKRAADRGVRIIIVGAGAAAHLAGVIASQTHLPVIGVPIDATSLRGLDALLSTVQMPSGIPVATVAIDGASNAAMLAVQILAVEDKALYEKLKKHRADMVSEVLEKDAKLNREAL